MEAMFQGLGLILDPFNFFLIFCGVLIGVIVGALPGLSSPMAVALLLPFTVGLEPIPAIAMLSSLYCATAMGDDKPGTALAMVLVCIALPLLWGERRAKVLVPYFVLFPLAVTVLFTQVLKVYFEPGAFGPEIH